MCWETALMMYNTRQGQDFTPIAFTAITVTTVCIMRVSTLKRKSIEISFTRIFASSNITTKKFIRLALGPTLKTSQ